MLIFFKLKNSRILCYFPFFYSYSIPKLSRLCYFLWSLITLPFHLFSGLKHLGHQILTDHLKILLSLSLVFSRKVEVYRTTTWYLNFFYLLSCRTFHHVGSLSSSVYSLISHFCFGLVSWWYKFWPHIRGTIHHN